MERVQNTLEIGGYAESASYAGYATCGIYGACAAFAAYATYAIYGACAHTQQFNSCPGARERIASEEQILPTVYLTVSRTIESVEVDSEP